MFLYSAGGGGTAPTDLYLPDGSDIKFTCISGCASYTTAVLQAQTTATKFYLSTVRYQTAIQFGYSLTLLDGTAYYFLGEAFASHELAAIVDRYGNQVTVTGNGAPITKVTSPNGRWFTFSYTNPSFPNYITSATDSAGRTVTYTYDAIGRLSTVVDANGGVTTYTYDSSNRILSVKDPKGITYVTNVYNSYGQVIQQTLGDGTSKYQLAYTPSTGGLATQTNVTDPNGNVRSVQFNANGYPASETTAYGTSLAQTTTYVRGVAGNPNLLQSVTDALNRTTAYAYDTIGNVSTVTRLSGTAGATTWSFTREPLFQRLQTITDPLGHVTSFAYDGAARLSQVSDSLNHVTSFAYDNEARVMSSIDSLNHIQSYQYQGPDLVSVTNALGHTNRRFADAAGRTLALTDPMGGQTLYTYDKNNNVLTMTNPVAGMTSLTYDLDNNLLSVTSPNSRTTTYTYNNLGQRTGQTDPLGHGDLYVFDSLGNLTQHTDRKGQITWSSYDALSRLNQITYSGGSTLGLTWDAANRVISLADSINGVVTRAYDGLDRLTQEVTPQGTVNYAYDADNRETSLSVMGGTAVTYGYDAGNRLLSVSQGSSAVSLAYDNVNRLTSLTLPDGVVATYGYDNGNELTSLSYAMGATNIDSMTYGYDSVGRNNHFVSALNQLTNAVTPVSACSYDGADEMLTFGSITTPTYDANGNLTGDGTNTYTWNSRNQLVSISGGVSASFTYDAVGRRASRTVNGITTTFVHDRANLVSEAIGANTAAYLTGPALDQVFSRTDSSGQMSYLRDGSGSILGLADPSGALVTQYNYEPYGNTSTSGASSSNPLQYAGRENDGTGLYFDRARYYRPAIGRFVSQDPIGFAGGINEYAYVGGNPIQFMDPTGLGETEFSGTLGTGAAVTGSIAYNSDTGMVTVGLGVGYGLGASGSVSYTGSAPAGSEGESSGVRGVTITPFVRASGELGSAEVEAESTSKGGEITGTLPLGPLGFGGKYDMSDGTLLPRTTEGFGASGGLFGGGKISFPLPSLGGGKQRNPGTDVGNNPDDEGGVCQSSAGFSNC